MEEGEPESNLRDVDRRELNTAGSSHVVSPPTARLNTSGNIPALKQHSEMSGIGEHLQCVGNPSLSNGMTRVSERNENSPGGEATVNSYSHNSMELKRISVDPIIIIEVT